MDSLFYLLGSKTLVIIYTASIKNLDNEFEGFGELLHKKITRSLQCFSLVLHSLNSLLDFGFLKLLPVYCFFSLSLFKKMRSSCLSL